MVSARPDADVRTRAIAAATRLFAERGFDGTALQDIADEVGVTKPAVLHHFPSKEHVRAAVIDGILAHWSEAVPRLLVAAGASTDRFDAVFGELARFFADDPDQARLVLREMLDRPAEMKRLLRQVVRPWLSAIAGYIRAGQEGGRHYADVDAEVYVVHILQLVIAASASQPVTSSVIEGEARARYDRELARIARSSLFVPRSPEAEKAPRRKTRK